MPTTKAKRRTAWTNEPVGLCVFLFCLALVFIARATTAMATQTSTRESSVHGNSPEHAPALSYPWPVWTRVVPQVPPSTTGATYYVDGANGSDAQKGNTPEKALKTIGKAVQMLAAGDTVLIRKGLYRESIILANTASGSPNKPITIGSIGDGEVIIDGSQKVTWTKVSGTIWRTQIAFTPIGVVVNESPLKQVRQGQGGSKAPQDGLAGVTSGSGKWHFDNGVLTADMGQAIGNEDPNVADIIVPNNIPDQQHVYFYRKSHLVFRGLTIRGSGSNGIWGYGSHVTIDSCNIKFNGKAAVSFLPDTSPGAQNTDNAVLLTHAYHNNLANWPRGNNGFAEAGGGWPGTLVWSGNLRPIARGNIVHMNGGEGIISYGTIKGRETGSAVFEQNVVYDNWSVNMYFDNQPNNIARNNFLFNRPPRPENFLYVGSYPYNTLKKYSVCLMLADEENSSDAVNGFANLNNTLVYNNLIVGCRIGIRDYAEGNANAIKNHGLKNTRIANNTIVMPKHRFENAPAYGIYLQDNKSPSGIQRNTNSFIQNNIIFGYNNDSLVSASTIASLDGITLSHNLYYSVNATWQGSIKNWLRAGYMGLRQPGIASLDKSGRFDDPMFVGADHFATSAIGPADYIKAELKSGSPASGNGTPQPFDATNFALLPRRRWNVGAF